MKKKDKKLKPAEKPEVVDEPAKNIPNEPIEAPNKNWRVDRLRKKG